MKRFIGVLALAAGLIGGMAVMAVSLVLFM